ncbi:MAG: hypothetical protein OCD00_12635 [Colwellia sp.]
MDIFTTQLTRVVPVPIKPTHLKVKALLKDAGASKLKEDPDHLENHDYYVHQSNDKDQPEPQSTSSHEQLVDEESSSTPIQSKACEGSEDNKNEVITDEEEKKQVKHLDLYA